MTSIRPYLVRAFYDWIIDNEQTPYVLVDATAPNVRVPQSVVRDGRIVLNIGLGAVTALEFDIADIRFSARFGGVAQVVHLPMTSVVAIYARENGQGICFDDAQDEYGAITGTAPDDDAVVEAQKPAPSQPVRKRPALRVVK